MTHGVLAPEALALLTPDLVSPGLIALVEEDAPTRTILCAGAGHFAQANVTLTPGQYIGDGLMAADQVIHAWQAIGDRADEIVPAYGFTQAERELHAAGYEAPTMATQR
jgi:hypothetical protein